MTRRNAAGCRKRINLPTKIQSTWNGFFLRNRTLEKVSCKLWLPLSTMPVWLEEKSHLANKICQFTHRDRVNYDLYEFTTEKRPKDSSNWNRCCSFLLTGLKITANGVNKKKLLTYTGLLSFFVYYLSFRFASRQFLYRLNQSEAFYWSPLSRDTPLSSTTWVESSTTIHPVSKSPRKIWCWCDSCPSFKLSRYKIS